MDEVFRALADPSRRLLLDLLFERDGRTLSELESQLDMTRFGAMKHLRVLEDAGLVTTRRVGRQKLHYLNPVPIRLVHDRWVSKYAEPWVRGLSDLKRTLEGDMEPTTTTTRPRQVYRTFIRTTPERLWEAITDGAVTRRYFYGAVVRSTFRVGDPITYGDEGQPPTQEGTILEADPPRRLVYSFTTTRTGDPEAASDAPTKVTWEMEPRGAGVVRLTLVHEDFESETKTYRNVANGWPFIVASLKTLLETGEPLAV
ncbi:MAG TPA: metalloregulator ArsR/SmtB family transcription factor [Candidatus Dormibacteraeota bacterium]